MGIKFFPSKIRKTATLNSENIRMLRIHVNNDIYNIYCLIHNSLLIEIIFQSTGDKIPFLRIIIMINRILHSWSFHTKFMKLAKGLFHKFHMK